MMLRNKDGSRTLLTMIDHPIAITTDQSPCPSSPIAPVPCPSVVSTRYDSLRENVTIYYVGRDICFAGDCSWMMHEGLGKRQLGA